MNLLARHGSRMAVTLIPLLLAVLHSLGVLPIGVLQRLDNIVYDTRLRATMPRTLDERIVIIDIDEKSLGEVGHWPWGRDRMARLADELFERQKAAVVGFDIVFAEPDESSGLKRLRQLAQGELKDQAGFAERLRQLQPALDYDALFARSLKDRPAVLGYYLIGSDREGLRAGVLPAPVMGPEALRGRPIRFTHWVGYGANIESIARAAPQAGYFNPMTDGDGVVRSVPLVAELGGQYYESLALSVFRQIVGSPTVEPGFPPERMVPRTYQGLDSIRLRLGDKTRDIPVSEDVLALVPFRGPGGASGGSYKYISASDLLQGRLPAGSLSGKIILVGTTAPGLLDLRVTPVGEAYAGVETHANLISGLLDGRIPVKPDYALGYDLIVLAIAGLVLAFALPLLSALRAVLLSAVVILGVVGLNAYFYLAQALVLPLAAALVMCAMAFALNMSWGYFVESRSKRELANLFGTYVPPELVDEMVKDPDSYSMEAVNKELTVMFCDMRGFTNLSESMEPTQLQHLLNDLFTRLTGVIRGNRGTIDKYMGDCVMAFWGAPVEFPDHAARAVRASMGMSAAVRQINEEHRARGIPEIGVGIGLNTGPMCVGDMGSEVRRAYTVIGDAVNLGSRLEGLSKVYHVETVVSESTRRQAPDFVWQELDRVRVKGKQEAVAIFSPLGESGSVGRDVLEELKLWGSFLKAYRAQDWDACDLQLLNLQRMNPGKSLYGLYAERVASMRLLPLDPEWDGATNFATK